MISIQAQLSEAVAQICIELGMPKQFAEVVSAERPEFGDYQCNGALGASRTLGRAPRELAAELAAACAEKIDWASFSVAGPGFVNIMLNDQYLAKRNTEMLLDSRLGCGFIENPRLTYIDFGGPNVAKPLAAHHLRSAIIGDTLQRLHRFAGNRVVSDVHIGDWGTNMGMVICGIRREQPNLPYFDANYTGEYPTVSPVTLADLSRIYPEESSRGKADPQVKAQALKATLQLQQGRRGYRALWEQFSKLSVNDARRIYDALGITFDRWDGESTVNAEIPPMLERLQGSGLAVLSEGALIFPLEPVPMLLLKSDGAYLYATTDLATLEKRVNEGAELLHYIADRRQQLHYSQFFSAGRISGIVPETVELQFHGYGTVNAPDGTPFKTRSGGTMLLEDLIGVAEDAASARLEQAGFAKDYPKDEQQKIVKMVALAALKFTDLINNKASDYVFDPERFTAFEGKTGPYLLYTAVRARSILRSAERVDGPISQDSSVERSLQIQMAGLPEAIERALTESAPHFLCEFAFKLAQEFNRFYQACLILREPDLVVRTSRVAQVALVLRQLELICNLLGIKIPERM